MESALKSTLNNYMVATSAENREECIRFASIIAQNLDNNEVKLVSLVTSLHSYLTSDDDSQRVRAMHCISDVLSHIKADTLTKSQISVLLDFLYEKFEDEFCLTSALNAVDCLVKMKNFASSFVEGVLRSLVKSIDIRSLPHDTRLQIFTLLRSIITYHGAYISEHKDVFIDTYIQLASGEKDPRNLMTLFETLYEIFTRLQGLEPFAEKLFDVSFCYFPITFRPPPNDPYKISAEDLKAALRKCLTANEVLAPLLVPSLIEKLGSTIPSVKEDVISTFAELIRNYSLVTLFDASMELFESLKFEVIHGISEVGEDNEVFRSSLNIFKDITRNLTLKSDSNTGYKQLFEYLDELLEEARPQVEKLDGQQSKGYCHILRTSAAGSWIAFQHIVDDTIPMFITLSGMRQSSENTAERQILSTAKQRTLIMYIDLIISAYSEASEVKPQSFIDGKNPLLKFKDDLLQLYGALLMGSSKVEVSLRVQAIEALIRLCGIPKFLDDTETGLVIQYFNEITTDASDNSKTKAAALDGLVELGRHRPDLIIKLTFPLLFQLLKGDSTTEVSTSLVNAANIETPETVLVYLSKLSTNKTAFEFLAVRLFSLISDKIKSETIDYKFLESILSTVLGIFETIVEQDESKIGASNVARGLFPALAELLKKLSVAERNGRTGSIPAENLNAHEEASIVTFARLFGAFIRATDSKYHEGYGQQASSLFSLETESSNTEIPDDKIYLFRSTEGSKYSLVLSSALAALTPKCQVFQGNEVENLVKTVLKQLDSIDQPFIRSGYLSLLAVVVNKWVVDLENGDSFISSVLSDLSKKIDESESTPSAKKTLESFAWFGKGLIVRNAKQSSEIIATIIKKLNSDLLGSAASRALEILVADDLFIRKENNVVYRLLFKQRFYSICVQMILQGYNQLQLEDKNRSNYITALSLISQFIPDSIRMPDIERIFSLLLQALALESNSEAKSAAISLISQCAKNESTNKLVVSHLQSIVPNLLQATSLKCDVAKSHQNSTRVRLQALQCLQLLAQCAPLSSISPYRSGIIRNLEQCLDDRKRTIRKAAIDCRQAYFELGSATSK